MRQSHWERKDRDRVHPMAFWPVLTFSSLDTKWSTNNMLFFASVSIVFLWFFNGRIGKSHKSFSWLSPKGCWYDVRLVFPVSRM